MLCTLVNYSSEADSCFESISEQISSSVPSRNCEYALIAISVTLTIHNAIQESVSLSPHAPWLTNKQFLSPLLVEYDHTISELNGRVSSYQSELTNLTRRVGEIVEENTKLHSDLRKSLESQLRSSGAGARDGGGVIEAVQEQLDILSRERDNYIDLWRQVSKELDAVQSNNRVSLCVYLDCDY